MKNEVTKKVEFLKRYNLMKFYDTAVIKWMHVIGFWYQIYKKNYSVDSHKSPGTVSYLQKFIDQYLAMDRRMHIWIRIENSEKI